MRGRAIVGKTIKRVIQTRHYRGDPMDSSFHWSLDAIQFTDGTWLRFVVLEGEGEYGILPVYPARPA